MNHSVFQSYSRRPNSKSSVLIPLPATMLSTVLIQRRVKFDLRDRKERYLPNERNNLWYIEVVHDLDMNLFVFELRNTLFLIYDHLSTI